MMQLLNSWIRQILVWMQRIRQPDFVVKRMAIHPSPDEIEPKVIILVGDRHLQKWACFQCPGGCGEVIKLSLNPSRRPCWSVISDRLDRPTTSPSVHQQNACGCHFWIRQGEVQWCTDSPNR